MSSSQKTLEVQHRVRQNAEEYRHQLNELYSWEKDIKTKEQALQSSATAGSAAHTAPVRSHVPEQSSSKQKSDNAKGSPSGSAASTPTEKQDWPVDPVAQQHKEANDIKDRGNNYVKLAEYDRAIEAYTEAVAIYPGDPVYYINRALCHLKQERFDDCIRDCEAAILLDKLCVKAYYRRMQANESLGNNMEALKDCTTVLALEPKNSEAKKSLQRINDRLRNIAKSGPNFNELRGDLVDILPIDKPAYKRSKKPLRRVPIVDIVSPRAAKDETKPLRISDEDIDKIFNSYCGPFEEVKKQANVGNQTATIEEIKKPIEKVAEIKELKPTMAQSKTENINKSNKKSEKAVIKQQKLSQAPKAVPQEPKITETEMERSLPAAPTGTAQFYISWKELSAAQKYQYLKSIETTKLCKILGAGFDSDTLTDILRTLHDYYVPNKEPTTAEVLLEMSKNDEFTILAMLLSAEEKRMLNLIMDAVKGFPDADPKLSATLSRAYHLA